MLKFFAGITAVALTLIAMPVTSQGTYECDLPGDSIEVFKDGFNADLVDIGGCKQYQKGMETFYDCFAESNFNIRRGIDFAKCWNGDVNCTKAYEQTGICISWKCTMDKKKYDQLIADDIGVIGCKY
ncbi:hypothetical protein O0I10_008722 [Lichtheimia ornata]|uniref:Uncharacterized protein n=1 Tax=Lichtheimia ornata TaxID=688661 RepID=A0AAD7UYZ1_9FUNG|nr:uncharacterized protein O0I10_008722 [Lichtheimia ornata]KAJ8655633.1 hypothetical protein O0I10_008722 [Lichtheimia ornata]